MKKKDPFIKNCTHKKSGISLFMMGIVLFSFGQEQTITGTVISSDTRETLPGTSVVAKGTTTGTVTDIDGKYSIPVPSNTTVLVFSFIGYLMQEVETGDRAVIDVVLVPDQVALDEIVVIGYGTVRKSDLTGSVSSVKAKDLVKITSLNPEQSLQGRVTGIQVSSTTGAPGATPTVRVRGVGTFNNSSPIYVVDGVILDNISFLNTADIASMEVLKDASATAIYGSRGANGVILITTKSGKIGEEKTTFFFSGEYGIQNLSKKIDLLDGKEFATISNQIDPGRYNNIDAVPNTDWQDLIFRSAPIQDYQLSAAGGTKATQYYIGVGYFNQKGIIDKSGYERISIKLNNTYQLTNFLKLGNNITVAPYNQDNAPNVTYQVYRASPVVEPYRSDGSFAGVEGVGNPLADLEYSNSYNKGVRAVGNIFAEAKLIESFSVKSSFGIDGLYNKSVSYSPAFQVYYDDGTPSMQYNVTNDLFKGNTDNFTWLWENTLNYNRVFNKHAVDAIAGYTMQNSNSEIFNVTGENILRDGSDFWYLQYNYITANKLNSGDFRNAVDANLHYSMISYLFRANYTYNNKYILTATFRRDGSSKFDKEARYGNFPSFAAGWNVSRERFMEDMALITNLKLRGSWGQIGNEKIPYTDRFSLTQNLIGVFGVGDVPYPAVTYAKNGNPDLRWETTTQTDIGLEIGVLNNRLTGEFDYYHRVTDDILVELSTPGHMGNGQGQRVRYNAGKILNRGFEGAITWRERVRDFSYGIGVLASTIHNEVLSIGGNSGVDSVLYGGGTSYGFVTQSREGLPVGAFWGYETDGLFQTQEELEAYPHAAGAGVGDLRRVDINNDGIIDGNDRTYLGSPIPKIIFGFNVELEYKNFDFSFSIQGQSGNKIFNKKEMERPNEYNFEKHVLDAWTGPGTSDSEPKASFGGYNYIPSDWFIQDGSFLRLRSMVLGYTLPTSVSQRMNMQQLRIYLKGNNLYTLTRFTGYTPEIASHDVLSNGIDGGIYPVTSIYSFGINLTF
ncbi:MAG: SusC/RagA family TonB-linked outer membrane protein [Bacteroidales bacterium]